MKRFMRLASKDTDTRRASFRSKKGDKLLKKDGFTLLYLGHSVLTDAKASDEVPVAIRTVKQSPTDQKIVQIVSQGIQLYVKEKEQELLTSPLTNISQCIQHTEEGFSDCFGLVFNSGPWIKQCHIFQAKSDKEVSVGRVLYFLHYIIIPYVIAYFCIPMRYNIQLSNCFVSSDSYKDMPTECQ